MKQYSSHAKDTSSAPRTCPFHWPKKGADAAPFRSRLIFISMLLMVGGGAFMVWRLYREQVAVHHSTWWAFGGIAAMLGFGLAGLGFAFRGLRRSAESLHQSEERVRAVIDTALDAVVTMDSAGLITDWNPQAEAIFGWARSDVIGRRMSETIIPDRYREAHEIGVRHFLATTEGPVLNRRIEMTALRRNGIEFPIELAITPLKSGATYTFAGFIRDISERKAAEAKLAQTHQELLKSSRLAGMAEVATGVLHNVGNVLNSVNVASSCMADSLRKSKAANLAKVVALLREHEADLGAFLTTDRKGKQIPGYLAQLSEHLAGEQAIALDELAHLRKNIEHIKDIVAMQQSFAKVSGVTESLNPTDLVEDALKMNASSLMRHDIQVIKAFEEVPPLITEKHKVLQILVNLVRNAKQACDDAEHTEKRLTVRVTCAHGAGVQFSVSDNGVGIPPENLTRIFNHGFTTKKDGHGFGLHSGALAAKELGGELRVHSDGLGQGSTFTLELPVENAAQRVRLALENIPLAA